MLWNPTLETGIEKIDEQHKELFRQVDILVDRSQSERIPETLAFLGNYVIKHFRDEQVMHALTKYPWADEHKKMHQDFVAKYQEMKNKYEASGDKLTVVLNINKVIIGWLKEHIMVQDKDFARFYKNRP